MLVIEYAGVPLNRDDHLPDGVVELSLTMRTDSDVRVLGDWMSEMADGVRGVFSNETMRRWMLKRPEVVMIADVADISPDLETWQTGVGHG